MILATTTVENVDRFPDVIGTKGAEKREHRAVDVVIGGIYSSTRQAIKGPVVDQAENALHLPGAVWPHTMNKKAWVVADIMETRSKWWRTWAVSTRRSARSDRPDFQSFVCQLIV